MANVFRCERVECCEFCSSWFPIKWRGGKYQFCSRECCFKNKTKVAVSRLWRQCQNCYNLFLTNEIGNVGKYCSRACSAIGRTIYANDNEATIAKYAQRKQKNNIDRETNNPIIDRSCIVCDETFKVRTNAGKITCSYVCGYRFYDIIKSAPRSTKRCKECDCEFVGTIRRVYCSKICSSKHLARPERQARRAKIKSVTVVKFNPIDVLQRDGWRCYICGVDTPRVLRGTYEDNAPELDHIIALANGGEHSPNNTACDCRRCNGFKSYNDNYPKEFRCSTLTG